MAQTPLGSARDGSRQDILSEPTARANPSSESPSQDPTLVVDATLRRLTRAQAQSESVDILYIPDA